MRNALDKGERMKISKYMNCLAIEMTRRCNMNCKFCGKGQAQNLDINKEIIDKTLDEMDGVYIEALRISGGEPLLVPNLICYLIEKIIEKHIYINNVCIFTNGTAETNLDLSNSISSLLIYLRNIEPEIRNLIRWSNNTTQKVYAGTNGSKFDIIISDNERNTDYDKINSTFNFYKQHITDEDFSIVIQSETFDSMGNITLEGNAKDNYKDLIGNEVALSDIRILNNNYYFMAKSANLESEPFLKDVDFITKTLSISSNGNVFPGCLMSYDNVDKNPMFNIMGCHKNFYNRVNDFCWAHPINKKALNIRNKYSAIEFCKKHNLKVAHMSDSDYDKIRALNVLVDKYEEFASDIHPILPNLDYPEIDAMATAILVNDMFEKNIGLDWIKLYLNWCTDFDESTINSISPEWCRGFILHLTEMDNKRK